MRLEEVNSWTPEVKRNIKLKTALLNAEAGKQVVLFITKSEARWWATNAKHPNITIKVKE